VKQIKDVKEQIEELKRERVWAEVIENEKQVSKLAASLDKLKSALPKYDKEIQESEEKITEIEERIRTVENNVSQVKGQAESYESEQQQIVAELQQRKRTFKEKQSALRRLQREVEEATSDQSDLQEKIEEMKSSAEMRNIEEEQVQNQSRLEQKKKELERVHCELKELNNRTVRLRDEEQNNKKQVARVSQDEESKAKEIKEKERRVQQAKHRTNDRLLKFGDWMPRVVNGINAAVREGRFTTPPRGPIGLHVHLKDQTWSKAIETCLKNLAYGFCVANYQDLKVLKTITARTCTKFFPVVLVCPFQGTVYDVASHKPNCQFPTVYDVLDIDDPVIANCLIDQLQIEMTLLIESRSLACQVIWSRNAPANKAFAASGDQIIGGRSAKSIAPPENFRNYLSSNAREDIRNLNQEINQKTQELSQLRNQKRTIENLLRQKSNKLQETSQRKKELHVLMNHLKLEIDELMEAFEDVVSPDISVLETDLEQSTQRLEDLSEQSQNAEQEKAEAERLLDKQQEVYDEHKRKIAEVLENAEPLKEELESLTLMGDQEKAKREHFEKERRKLEQKIDQNERERDGLLKLAEQKAEQASQHFERVETTRSVTDLETEIIKKQRYINEEEKNRGSVEEVTKQFNEITDRFTKILQNKKNIHKYNKYLTQAMERRMSFIKEKRKYLACSTSQFFTRHLSRRGFSGYITFDHSQETLELIVNVHKGPNDVYSERDVDESTSVMKSLSGGERSVSTICFLTALWGAMESPFRCLDEFDVFMDLCNRRVIMKMVLELAVLPEQKNRQFIFLTPQDLSSLPIDKKLVKIFKLDNPER